MTQDMRKEFDKWLKNQKDIHPDVKAALASPLAPPITEVVTEMASIFTLDYVHTRVPEEIQSEAWFRVSMMHKAIKARFKAYAAEMSTYALFTDLQEQRDALQKLVEELLQSIRNAPKARKRISKLLAEQKSKDINPA